MNLFYAPDITKKSKTYIFDKEESRHITKSLRKRVGDKLFITNGKGDWFEVLIMDDNPKKTLVEIIKVTSKPQPDYHLHIAMAPTKSNERYEWFLEKATELGITEISPILTRYSERKKINAQRYEKVLVAAMKQSLQAYKPKLNELTSLSDFLNSDFTGYQKFIAYCQAEEHLNKLLLPHEDTIILIGPEGGFTGDELQKAKAKGFIPIRLSPNRLRTETAGILSVAAVNLKNSNEPNK